MQSSAQLIEHLLETLSGNLLELAARLGERIPETYGLGYGWNWSSTTKGLRIPKDITRPELREFFSVVYIATCLRDHFLCRFCGFDGLLTASTYAAIQVDHLLPRAAKVFLDAEDGLIRCFSPENLVTACCGCNKIKRNREFRIEFDMARDQKIDAVRAELFADLDEHSKATRFLQQNAGKLPSRPVLD